MNKSYFTKFIISKHKTSTCKSYFDYLSKSLHVQRLSNIYANIFFFFGQRISKTLKESLDMEKKNIKLNELRNM